MTTNSRSGELIQTRRCGLCRGRSFKQWWLIDGYAIAECRDCKLVQVAQELKDDDLKRIYGKGYYNGESARVYEDYLANIPFHAEPGHHERSAFAKR